RQFVIRLRRHQRVQVAALVTAQTDHELAEQAWLQKTADFAEGVRAVAERRPGRFSGE
ncbi:MAG: enoyl-CoA hydratase/isomerase family protein, partial [Sphingomonas sp.]